MRIKERDPITGLIKDDFVDLPIEITLDVAKQRKYDEIKATAATYLATFKSSALGSEYTYLSGLEDMLLMAGEYAYVKGSDFDNNPIFWYTLESGNLSHTGAQYISVYLDARLNVQTVKYRQATLNAQIDACTTIDAVNLIIW